MKTLKILNLICLVTSLFISGCKKDDDNSDDNNKPTAKFYFQATIDGKAILLQDGINGYGNGVGEGGGGSIGGDYQVVQSSNFIKYPSAGSVSAGICIIKTFDTSVSYDFPSHGQIDSMFWIGPYPYGIEDNNGTSVDGASVYYVDENNTYWSSDQGSAVQTNSTFSITEHVNNTDGYSQKISKAVFSCILYDENGNSKTLTNGILRGRTVLYTH